VGVQETVSTDLLEVTVGAYDHHQPRCLYDLLDQPLDHVMLLCYRDGLNPAESDANALMSLLQVRHVLDDVDAPETEPSIVAELLDQRDVDLARVTRPDDFIVSDRLTSLLLAQLSENPALDPVFRDLLDPDGVSLGLRPVEWLVPIGAEVQFREVVAAGADLGLVVLGLRYEDPSAADGELGGGIVVNPSKQACVRFAAGDQVIVVAGR
jgi:hypothetical protein